MATDNVKVASAVNHLGWAILEARAAVDRMQVIQAKFVAANPSVIGTPLEGQTAAVASNIVSLRNEVDKPFWDAVIVAIVPSHRGEAL